MKISVKLTAAVLALGVLSGCATHQVSDRLVCATAGAIAGGLIAGAMNSAGSSDVGIGIAAGAAVATLLCPTTHEPVCAEVAPEGALLDANGCAFDSDNDGVVDGIDQCPGTPAGIQVDAHGCALDSDGDGVVNHHDQCPFTPAGIVVDEKGCPLAGETILSLTGVNFATNKADLTPHAMGQLDEAIESLTHATNVVSVRIEGHTDSTGTEKYNHHLSQKRAEAVVHYLVSHGINAEHLHAVGMGEGHPAARNDTAEGRAQNRRVDFVVSQ